MSGYVNPTLAGSLFQWQTYTVTLTATATTAMIMFKGRGGGYLAYDGASLVLIGSLPVKLINFKVLKENNTVLLDWESAEESNTDHFNIERSKDAKNWNTIGMTTAAGESKSVLKYSFSDVLPISGLNYYRLKMYDKDFTFSYSKIQSVELGNETTIVEIYPNPTSEVLVFKNLNPNNIKELNILNINGQLVYKCSSNSFLNSIHSVDVSKWHSGTYIVNLIYQSSITSKHKIVILK